MVSLLLKADTGTDWIQIDLTHGPGDRVPRRFTIGPGLPNRGTGCWMARRCGVEAAGTVDLEVLEPGKRAAGRYRFSLDGSPEVEAAFEATWMEGVWAVQPCPTPS